MRNPSTRSKPLFTADCKAACRVAQQKRRQWQRMRSDSDRKDYVASLKAKRQVLRREANEQFHWFIEEVSASDEGLRRLARWSKRRDLPRGRIPPLRGPDGVWATSTDENRELFTRAFFPAA